MNVLDDVMVGVENGRLYITCDKDILMDLYGALLELFNLSRILKMKAVAARAETAQTQQAEFERLRPVRAAAFKEMATRVFTRFNEHMNNGCAGNKAAALKATRQEFNLLAVDARVFLAQGKRLAAGGAL